MMARGTRPTRQTIRRILIAVMAATALTTAVMLITHRSKEATPPMPGEEPTATLSLDKVRHTSTRQGVDEWSVEADTVHLFNTENRAVFNRLTARYFEKSGAVTVMTANKGTLDTQTKDLEVTGHVVVKRGEVTITSDAFSYSKAYQVITSKTPVTITDGRSTVSGDALFLAFNDDLIKLDGDVTGTILDASNGNRPDGSGPVTTLTADKSVLNTRTSTMEAIGHVVVKRGEVSITSDALTYSKKAQAITSQTPVAISDGISTLAGDALFLDLNTERLTLDGTVTGTLYDESKGNMNEARRQ